MSRVPMSYRDWWDDWDMPVRTSRLLDQHFGTGLRRNDLLSSLWDTSSPSVLRTGYVRPWRNTNVQRQDSGSTLNLEKDKFQVILDVQQFIPNEITVKTTDKFIIVEGKHEEKEDEHGFVQRHFVRKYVLPNGVNPNDVASTLSSDGLLTVSVPLKPLPPPNTDVLYLSPQRDQPRKRRKLPNQKLNEFINHKMESVFSQPHYLL